MPPIRYPLPTLIVVIVVSVLIWRGEAMTRPVRAALAARWQKATEGPPIPSSDHPQVIAGPITRRALIVPRGGVTAARLPGGGAADTIRVRMFVQVYDVWPLRGSIEYCRVGNRAPIGWVKAAELLPWSTRLVVQRSDAGQDSPRSSPVVGSDAQGVDVADWPEGQPWGDVAPSVHRASWAELPEERWGAWMSREEVLKLLMLINRAAGEDAARLRLRAVAGLLNDDRPIDDRGLAEAHKFLPEFIIRRPAQPASAVGERLARLNEDWSPEAAWGGVEFACVPLDTLP